MRRRRRATPATVPQAYETIAFVAAEWSAALERRCQFCNRAGLPEGRNTCDHCLRELAAPSKRR